jgi:hypothetical protein
MAGKLEKDWGMDTVAVKETMRRKTIEVSKTNRMMSDTLLYSP